MSRETSGALDHDGERLAWRRMDGEGPIVVWLGGFRSDMGGTKAQALADWAAESGRAYLRFDYSGHGESSGALEDGTIGRWKADALAAIDRLTEGSLVLVGSSMGGWLACLAALERPDRVAGMVLIAPAADFTEALMRPALPDEAHAALEAAGLWMHPSDYGEPWPLTARFLDEGREHQILTGDEIPIDVPVHVLQGGEDPDVPWDHALALALSLRTRDAVFTLIKDGDHRLSRLQDLDRLIQAVEEVSEISRSAGSS